MNGVQVIEHTHSRIPSETSEFRPSLPAAKPAARFAFVDGLRGMAALGIVIFHIWWYEPAPKSAIDSVHWTVDAAVMKTRGAVQILLVISGFVIAYTMRHIWFTRNEAVLFLARRVVRLVPAYWTAIAFVLLVDAFCRGPAEIPSPFDGAPTLQRTLAHMVFLQDIVGQESISAGMWTLCIEMQFYLVAILGWGLAQRLLPRPVPGQPRPSALALFLVFAPPALGSLLYWRLLDSTTEWVIHFFWMFFLGMVTWWTLDRSLPKSAFALFVAIAVVELIFNVEWRNYNAVALGTAIAIYTAGELNRLHIWLNWRPLQYLGRVSYSLYLIHFPICHLVTAIGWKLCGNSPTPPQALAILISAIPASLLAAHVLYRFVEMPSAGWSARLKGCSLPDSPSQMLAKKPAHQGPRAAAPIQTEQSSPSPGCRPRQQIVSG